MEQHDGNVVDDDGSNFVFDGNENGSTSGDFGDDGGKEVDRILSATLRQEAHRKYS